MWLLVSIRRMYVKLLKSGMDTKNVYIFDENGWICVQNKDTVLVPSLMESEGLV